MWAEPTLGHWSTYKPWNQFKTNLADNNYVCLFFKFPINSQLILNVHFLQLCFKPTFLFCFIKTYHCILYFVLVHSVIKCSTTLQYWLSIQELLGDTLCDCTHAHNLSVSVSLALFVCVLESWDRIDGDSKNSPLMILTSTSQPAWLTLAQAPLRLPLCAHPPSTLTSKCFVLSDCDS